MATGSRQDHRHGHADRLADRQRRPDARKQLFSRGFLIVTPGITIKDRLRVLQPNDPESYYRHRDLVPRRHAAAISTAPRSSSPTTTRSSAARRWSSPRPAAPSSRAATSRRQTLETDGQMLRRACGDLLGIKSIIVINDEAHHCYREKARRRDDETSRARNRTKPKRTPKPRGCGFPALEALKRKLGIAAVFDLSATPFFLRGSGYREGRCSPGPSATSP